MENESQSLFEGYNAWIKKNCVYNNSGSLPGVVFSALSLASEAGEVCNVVRFIQAAIDDYDAVFEVMQEAELNHVELDPGDIDKIKQVGARADRLRSELGRELGDVLCCVLMCANDAGIDAVDMINNSWSKLRQRAERGWVGSDRNKAMVTGDM